MSNLQATNYKIKIEYDGSNTKETINCFRESDVVVTNGEHQFERITPASSVAITHAFSGRKQRLVGFSSLHPLQSLRSLLEGTLFPDMPSKLRLTIAKAIAADLKSLDPEFDNTTTSEFYSR